MTNNSVTARRWFMQQCGIGLGGMALQTLLHADGLAGTAAAPLAPRAPHFPAKAKHVIYMFQAGAPSNLELFDYKQELAKHSRELTPVGLLKK